MKKISSVGRMIVLNTYWLGLSFKWNALHPIILPAVMLNYVPENLKNTYLGLLTFGGLVLAAVFQPVAGAMSDGWYSRWGRRRPLMVVSALFDLVFLAVIGWAGGLFWLFIGYIGLQFSSNLGQGPAQGLMPDRVAPEKLGVASGIKTFMDMAALIVASLAAGRLLDPDGNNPTRIFLVLMGVLVISTGDHGSRHSRGTHIEDRRVQRKEILVAGTAPTNARGHSGKYHLLVVDRPEAGFHAGNFCGASLCPILSAGCLESGKPGENDR